MSPEQRQQLKALIVATSLYYGQEIPDAVLGLYVEDLADLPFDAIVEAIRAVRRDPKTTRFPLPALIRDRIAPENTDEADAREAAARIISAISRYGYTNLDRARAYIGSVGWRVVELQGGWTRLCEGVTSNQIPSLQAQLRDLAMGTLRRARLGILDQPPQLPGGGGGGGLFAISKAPDEKAQLTLLRNQLEQIKRDEKPKGAA